MWSYRQSSRPNKNALSLASCESYPVKTGKFGNFKFSLLLKLTNEKDIDKAQILFLLETSSCQIWKIAFLKWHSQSLNAATCILKQVYSRDKLCLELHRNPAGT